jgi:predicted permease
MVANLVERVRAIVWRRRVEAEMDEEMRFHIERDAQERIHRGLDPAEARREALLAFGGLEQRKEQVRDVLGLGTLELMSADLRHAGRAMRRNPLFFGIAIAVLALGVGTAGAVYGVSRAVILDPLSYPESDRIVRIFQGSGDNLFGVSVVDVLAIADQQRSFDMLGAVRQGEGAIGRNGAFERHAIGYVTAGLMPLLALRAEAGRLFEPGDEASTADPVIVLSAPLALRWFGASRDALGNVLNVDGVSHRVIGVLPGHTTDIAGLSGAAWRVFRMEAPERRGPFGIRLLARLRDGVTLEAAARDLAEISDRIFPLWKSTFRDSTSTLTPVQLRTSILGPRAHRNVGLLAGGVALVLLVAVTNVALLVMARVSSREGELAVRSALGADGRRLARLLAAEGIVLAAGASGAGFGIAYTLLRAAPLTFPAMPRIGDVVADWRIAFIIFVLSVIAAGLVMLAPVLSALTRPATTSMSAGRRVESSPRANLLRSTLVATEFGLVLPLLACGTMLVGTFLRLQRVDPGYEPEGVLAVRIGLPVRYAEPAAAQSVYRLLEQRLFQSPVLAEAGFSGSLPPSQPGEINNFDLIDRPVPPGSAEHVAPWNNVTNGFFAALGVPLLEGRFFTASDTAATELSLARPVVLVSRSWARRYYPNESALGKTMIQGGCTVCPRTTIVGVVGDVKYRGLDQPADAVYRPLAQAVSVMEINVVVRGRRDVNAAAVFEAVREAVASLDPEIPVTSTTFREQIERSLAEPRRWAVVVGVMSAAGLLLATVGIFGLMAYAVRQRRREIGVRMALGATTGTVIREVTARGLRWAATGCVAGVLITLALAKWVQAFLFDVDASDPRILGGVFLLLLATAAVACWLAARKSASIQPVEAIACAVVFAMVLVPQRLNAQDTTLAGLWRARQWYGPELRGELRLERTASGWSAAIAGRATDAQVMRDTVRFDFASGGSFVGQRVRNGSAVAGHWIQPRTRLTGRRHATPVTLASCGSGCFSGNVNPMEDPFTFYLNISANANGALSAFLRNPERNQGRFIQLRSVTRRDDTVTFRNATDTVIAQGFLRGGALRVLLGNSTFDFGRIPRDSFTFYYPRGRPNASYTYKVPRLRNDGWHVSTPEDVGMSRQKLTELVMLLANASSDSIGTYRPHALLIARHGKLILEEYFHGEHADKPHDTRSGSKAVVSLVLGAAMQTGMKIGPETPVYAALGQDSPALDPRKRAMRLKHLLSMSSGLDCNDWSPTPLPGNEDVITEQDTAPDWRRLILDLKMLREPGESFAYCSINSFLAGEVIALVAGRSFLDLTRDLVSEPLQMGRYHVPLSPLGVAYLGGGVSYLPRDYLKVAQLYANGGTWNGKRIVSRNWVEESIRPRYAQSATAHYAYLFITLEYPWQGRRVRAYFAGGNGGQFSLLIPELDLVIGVFGGNYADASSNYAVRTLIPSFILPAIVK